MSGKETFSWRLGEYMIQRGWITWEQLQEALGHQEKARKGIVAQVPGQAVFAADARSELSLGEVLVRNTWITWEQLKECLNEQKESGKRTGEILLRKNYISEENLARGLAIQYNLAYVDLAKEKISKEAVARLPKDLAHQYQIIPLVERAGIFLLVCCDPTDDPLDLRLKNVITGAEIHTAVTTPSLLRQALTQYYP